MIPDVSVYMITYNHEAYISQAIEGILKQKTSYTFELLIGEDHSLDNTRQICEKYAKQNPEKIKLLPDIGHNLGVTKNLFRTFQACSGKYLALCEGDDFWTNPNKLHQQVDFLEANTEYGLVHGDVNLLDQKTGKITSAYNKTNNFIIPSGAIFEFLMKPSHSIKSMTVCFRKDLFEEYYLDDNKIMIQDWKFIDISIWLMLAAHTKIHYIDEVMATYRLLQESLSRTKNPQKLYQFHQKIYSIRKYFANNYKCSEESRIMIETSNAKAMLADAYMLNDYILAEAAMNQLKKLNLKINIKQKAMYLSVKHPIIKCLIDFVR